MRKVIAFIVAVAMVGLVLLPTPLFAQAYPNRPITLIVPFAAGGSTDLLARAVERVWPKYSTQPLVVQNRPGGGGVVGTEFVVRSRADGYTLYFGYGSGHDTVMPHLQRLPYAPFEDLVPVSLISVHSVVIVTGAGAPFRTIRDMIAWARRENRPLTAAVSTAAGSVDIALRAVSRASGIPLTTVPFAGGAEAVTALAGGHVVIGGGHPSEVMPHIRAGRFVPMAIALPERDSALPDIPTLKEQGVNISTWGSIKGVAAPKGTPSDVIAYLDSTFKKVCEDPDFKKMMGDLFQPIMYKNAADFGRFLQEAFADYGRLIADLNIRL